MNYKIILIISFILFIGFSSQGQDTKYNDVTTFATEMKTMMDRTKSPDAKAISASFDTVWSEGGFSTQQKEVILDIANQMNVKKMSPRPHFQHFLTALVYSVTEENINTGKKDDMLDMILKSVKQFSEKENDNLFIVLSTMFYHKSLYHSAFSKIGIDGHSYKFNFIAPIEVIDEEIFVEETESGEEDDGWFEDWDDDKSGDDWDTNWDKEEDFPEPEQNQRELYETPQPILAGPIITFETLDLYFLTSFDSTSLMRTSGSLMLTNNVFVGLGGKFDWSVTGLSSDSVYCDFDKYNFNITKTKISAENVKMSYKGKLDTPVSGVFDFESHRSDSPFNSRYPRFKSYENDVKVKLANDGELIYNGGFSMEGRKISSSSLFAGPASIEVRKKGVRKFRSKAKRYILNDSIVEAEVASVVIYQNSDSIVHPAIRIKYNFKSDNLIVLKDQGRYKYAPFFASFFNMDITADMIRWNLNEDSLDISILNARNQIPAYFESQEYFNPDRFSEMAGLYKFHPLFLVVGYSRKINSGEFNVDDLIEFSKRPEGVVRSAMEFLMSYHYIDYNSASGEIKVRRKAYHNVLSKNRRKDYDNLLIASKLTNMPNATYFLSDNELTVRGIDKFYISELLDVYIIPDKNEITLKKNRDFTFNGQLFVGNFEYIGKDFTFQYDSFKVDMQVIDSLRFYIEDEDSPNGGKKLLENKLIGGSGGDSTSNDSSATAQRTSGTLLINKPNNKSARRVYPGYPSFNAENGSVIYFGGKDVLGGAYADRSVYFVVPPFKIDSLSESDVRSLGFEGTFVTSGLLPEFKEKLRIMPDNSLGFVHQAPINGYEIQGDKGKFYKTLTLDKNGLRGNGKIEYLSSTLKSNDFVFYTDSIVTNGSSMVMDKKLLGNASFPDAVVDNYKLRWIPKKDSMFIHNNDAPFQLYDATASLNGFLNVTPEGVLGGGQLLTRGSESVSNELSFTSNLYSARHAKFEIKSDNPEKPALSGDDIRLQFNLDRNDADISPEIEGVAAINFPYAQMKTSITNAKWNLDDRSVTMVKPDEVDINSSYFYSTREELDSLAFNAAAATYDINSLQLHVTGIPFIKVADAKVTPENSELTILENSELQPLENASLVIDTLNSFHNLSDGHITIISRNEFVGDATYDLVAAADTFGIKFNSFEMESVREGRRGKKLQTVSRGTIEEMDRILVSPKMIFKGTATMYATRQALELDGFVKLDLQKISGYDTWIEYKSISDTQQVIIEYAKIVTNDGTNPISGLHFEAGEFNLYPTFVNERRTMGDEDFFVPGGMLMYDETEEAFKIEDPLKTSGKSFAGKSFTYDEENSKVTFEGPLNFLSQNTTMKLKAAGKGEGNIDSYEYNLNAFLAFDFDVPLPALNEMALDIQDLIERVGLQEAHEDKTKLLYKAAELMGNKSATMYDEKSQEEYISLVSQSSELVKALVISDVDLEWSDTDKAFYSSMNSKIGISNISRNDINARTDGFIEIRKTEESGDIINIFLKISSSWYYIGYADNRLVLFSNNREFNEIIKSKTNVAKAKIGEFVFIPGEMNEVQNFVDEFRKVYYDINDSFILDEPTQVVSEESPIGSDPQEEDPMTESDEDDDEGF